VLRAVWVLLIGGVAWAAPQWTAYCNERFGFCVQRPAFLTPQPPPENGDGMEFRQGGIRFIAFGSQKVFSLPKTYELAQKGVRVTYKQLRPDFFVVSGYKGSFVVYHHTRVMGDAYVTLYFEYPASQKAAYDPLIKPTVDSLKPRR